ncbi:MAG: GAF domain-containing protein, partial [Candidatus Methylomirabilota bacterium]
ATAMEAGEIWLLDAADSRLRLARQRGCDGELFGERPEFALGEGIPGVVAQTAEPVVVPDLAADPRFLRRRVVAAGFTALAAVPLRAKGEVIGTLDVATRHARPVTEDDLRLLTAIGAAVGMAAANARLYERLARATQQLEAMTGTLDARLNELERMQAKLAAFEPMGTTDRPSAPPAV